MNFVNEFASHLLLCTKAFIEICCYGCPCMSLLTSLLDVIILKPTVIFTAVIHFNHSNKWPDVADKEMAKYTGNVLSNFFLFKKVISLFFSNIL